jgi:poly-gamma-glutamate capsule biosynthesis protein CapA/YwtB (metallophosphatase superfamily)
MRAAFSVLVVLISGVALAGAGDGAFTDGTTAAKAGDIAAAQAAFGRCLDAEPARTDCAWELGWTYWKTGDWQHVVESWERIEKVQPDYPQLAKYLGDARTNRDAKLRLQAILAAPLPPPRPALPADTRVRLRAVGDVMLGTTYPEGFLPPEDGVHSLDAAAPLLRDADLTFGNLEGPLCDHGESTKCAPDATNCYAFRVPTRYGKYLDDAGFDVMSTANNHNGDFGDTCRRENEATLDALGIAWSGAPGSIATIDVHGVSVGLVGFHTSPATNDVNDLATAKALVKLAKATHDLVIVSFHGGAEGSKATHVKQGHEMFLGEDRGDLPTFAHTVIDAGADLVLGHGPHVLRAMELYKGHLIAYSLGNFATYGRFNLTGAMSESVILDVTIDAHGQLVTGKLLPMHQIDKGLSEPDPSGSAIATLRALSAEDFPQTAAKIGEDGTLSP